MRVTLTYDATAMSQPQFFRTFAEMDEYFASPRPEHPATERYKPARESNTGPKLLVRVAAQWRRLVTMR